MKRKYKVRMFLLILGFVCTYNFLLGFTNNGNPPKEVKEVKQKIKKESTNNSLVLKDFQNINDKAKIKANKDGNKLIVQITQGKNNNDLKANFVNITQYTDWACKNIKNDIEILDISVLLPESKIRAVLSMDKMVDNDYFDENYVKECIEND